MHEEQPPHLLSALRSPGRLPPDAAGQCLPPNLPLGVSLTCPLGLPWCASALAEQSCPPPLITRTLSFAEIETSQLGSASKHISRQLWLLSADNGSLHHLLCQCLCYGLRNAWKWFCPTNFTTIDCFSSKFPTSWNNQMDSSKINKKCLFSEAVSPVLSLFVSLWLYDGADLCPLYHLVQCFAHSRCLIDVC